MADIKMSRTIYFNMGFEIAIRDSFKLSLWA